jgi:GDP-4-dehydro-6-deoxy-D-mannose reductase
MRVLITGASGFVGRHLVELCKRSGATVVGLGRTAIEDDLRERLDEFVVADLRDAAATTRAVRSAHPERVFHLAGQASVATAWSDPQGTIAGNLTTSLNLLESVRLQAPDASVLVTGSGEAYGPVPDERLPVTELEPLRPQNPYAVSKAAVEMLSGFYADAHGLTVVRTRAFNHCGPGQRDDYVVASLASQIAAAEAAAASTVTVTTGNMRPRRDFTDVRDVVRAYWLAADLAAPDVYNVCSGRSIPIADILAKLAAESALEVEHRTDAGRQRKREVMEVRGAHDKLTAATGWRPEIPLEQTLRDTLDWWRDRIALGAQR